MEVRGIAMGAELMFQSAWLVGALNLSSGVILGSVGLSGSYIEESCGAVV